MEEVTKVVNPLEEAEEGEEAGDKANPKETLTGARKWVVFIQRTHWR